MTQPTSPCRWPFNTRIVASIAADLGLSFQEHGAGEGYLFSLSDGARTWFLGTGPIDAFPINSSTACAIARDKAFTALIAQQAGIACIPTELFFLSDRFSAARRPGRELTDLMAGIHQRRYPLFIKPNKGSRGDFAEIIHGAEEIPAYLERVGKHYDQIVLQPFVSGREIRLFLVDQRCFFQYEKTDVCIRGDNLRNWHAVLADHNAALQAQGLSELSESTLRAAARKQQIALDGVSDSEQVLVLPGRRNITASGAPTNFRTTACPALEAKARSLMGLIGLRVAAVDFILPDHDGAEPEQALLLEVNGNPSMDSLEAMGQEAVARAIWQCILRQWKNRVQHA